MEWLPADDFEYSSRSEYWLGKSQELPSHKSRVKRRDRRPLIVCGHGANFQIDRGTLFIRNGFTHYPQEREEFRFFRGDPHLPNRIVIFDVSGSISFDVLAWLSEQNIPLVQLNWEGESVCIANSHYSANPKLVAAQRKELENGKGLQQFQKLIAEKFKNSISTLQLVPDTPVRLAAINYLKSARILLTKGKPISKADMLGIEGQAASLYFAAWRGMPIKWKLSKREIIPNDWKVIPGGRRSLGKTNRNARHPINAMLNYAYAILQPQMKMRIIAEGLDPTIGLSHSVGKYRDALVLDRMEPLRPVVDGVVLQLVVDHVFRAADFTITGEGYCRLNPQLARKVVSVTSAVIAA